MSRTLTCDFCKKTLELNNKMEQPYGWHKYKMDSRDSGNIGGAVFNFDACKECYASFKEKKMDKQKAIKIFKAVLEGEL